MLDERPYLSEAGAAVFDALYDTVIRQVSYLVKAPSLSRDMVSMVTLIKDAINVLIGVPSKTFLLDKVRLACVMQNFTVQLSDKISQNDLHVIIAARNPSRNTLSFVFSCISKRNSMTPIFHC